MAFEIERLDGDAEGFFGLAPGFGERELQRAYHAAIRVFRPESRPREFQRIREARDRLLEEARWRAGAEGGDPPTVGGAVVPPPVPLDLALRTSNERAETYRSLAASPGGARDYATLALLSDTLPAADRGFEGWLLEGLARHPDDEGLEALIRVYVQEDLAETAVARFLRTASRVVPRTRLWTVFASAWETAAIALPVREFESVWDDCEDPGSIADETARAWLLARILPSLVARSDGEWVASRVRWLASRHDQVADGAGALDALEDWEPLRRALAAAGRPIEPGEARARAWRRLLDRPAGPARFPAGEASALVRRLAEALLGAGVRGGEARLRAAARAVVERQQVILRGFPARDPESIPVLRFLRRSTALIARDVEPAFEPTGDESEETDLVYAVHRRSEQARRRSWAAFVGWWAGGAVLLRVLDIVAWLQAVTLAIWAVVGTLVFDSFLEGRGVYGWLRWTVALGLLALTGWGVVWLYRHWFWPGKWAMERVRVAWERFAYRSKGRSVAIDAIREVGLTPEAMVDPERLAPAEWDPVLARGVSEDPALRILWVAHRFAT